MACEREELGLTPVQPRLRNELPYVTTYKIQNDDEYYKAHDDFVFIKCVLILFIGCVLRWRHLVNAW